MYKLVKNQSPNIVLIGGGSGSAALYPELIHTTPNAVAIVSMSDSGGSTGEISMELDVPPVGDLRNVMLAASSNLAIRAMRMHRHGGTGNLKGHTWGNITIAACIEEYGPRDGVKQAMQILQVPGQVLPITLDRHTLVMEDGLKIIRGQREIDMHTITGPETRVWLDPASNINPEALSAIKQADLIVIAPGSYYTSLLPALSAVGVREALNVAKVPKVLVANLVTEAHITNGWHVVDFVHDLESYRINLDYVLYNTKLPSASMLANYLTEGEEMVDWTAERFAEVPKIFFIGAKLLSDGVDERNPNDKLERSYIRHNPVAVRKQLWKILNR